jgi:outer membrane protein
MKKIHNYIFILTLTLFPALGFCQENQPLTLRDCYKLALKQSELIAINSELIKQAEAHFLQALGTVLPQVSFARSEEWENSKLSPASNRSYEQKFVFQQALFTGFKEFAAMASSNFEKKQRENEKLRAQQLLFVDVSDAFYLLMEVREDLRVLETIKVALSDRISELNKRVDLGKSRTSEVVNTEVQLYTLFDQIEVVKNQELVVKELLEFMIGKPLGEIVDPGTEISLKPESEYLKMAASRADVQAADFAWQADKKNIIVAKSGFLPSVSLEGDYFNHRSSAPKDSRWDTLLSINVPIFEGTTTYGQVKEAVSLAKESELLFSRVGRVALREIHDSYVTAQTAFSRITVLKKALGSAELNYDLQTKDYELSVVNNLDVLTAIQDLYNIRRNFIRVTYECKRFYWHLLVAAGDIDVNN